MKRREKLSQSPARRSNSPRRRRRPLVHPRSWEAAGRNAGIPEIFDAEALEDGGEFRSLVNRSMSPKPTVFSSRRNRDREEKKGI